MGYIAADTRFGFSVMERNEGPMLSDYLLRLPEVKGGPYLGPYLSYLGPYLSYLGPYLSYLCPYLSHLPAALARGPSLGS